MLLFHALTCAVGKEKEKRSQIMLSFVIKLKKYLKKFQKIIKRKKEIKY